MDNSGDSIGFVVDRRAFARRRRPYPLAARSRCGGLDHKPRDWTASGLGVSRKGARFFRKGAKENLQPLIPFEGFPLRLCVFGVVRVWVVRQFEICKQIRRRRSLISAQTVSG